MASYFQKILGMSEAPATETGAALQDVDQGLLAAKAAAEKRRKIAELQQKLANLKAQREQVAADVAAKKEKRAAITDDEIVRMAKIKGIKDEDVQAYVNGRISQRRDDLSSESIRANSAAAAAESESAKATAAAAKAKEVKAKEEQLLQLEKDITSAIYTKVPEEQAETRKASFELLKKQYENAMAEYKALSEKDWNDKNFVLDPAPAPAETGAEVQPEAPRIKLPEGSGKWKEQDKTEYLRPETSETKRAEIVARYAQNAKDDARAESERKERFSTNSGKGKAAEVFENAKYYAQKAAKDSKPKKTYTALLTEWGWDVPNKKKVVK